MLQIIEKIKESIVYEILIYTTTSNFIEFNIRKCVVHTLRAAKETDEIVINNKVDLKVSQYLIFCIIFIVV
jgi:hypothetical protein